MKAASEKVAADILAERIRQVEGEGYSVRRDDGYRKGEMAQAAACYASCAGQPNILTTQWPWGRETWKPSADRRRDLVKAGALILAEIERIDREGLIQPEFVRRDEGGWWSHPGYLAEFDEEATSEQLNDWFKTHQLEHRVSSMESEVSDEEYESYFESCDCSLWEPSTPEGDGWFKLSIHDTEDGPVCVWGRRV
jgi:hypothetical protein